MMNRSILLVLSLAIFSAVLGQGLVVPLLPVYASSLGASAFYIGLIFGIFSISRTLFLPYFGRLSDLKGRKPLITWGLGCYLLASIAYMMSYGVTALIVIRFLQGISSAMIVPVVQAYAAEISPPGAEGRIMGIINIALYFGLSAGPVFGGMINDWFGIRAAFGAMGVVCLFGLVLSIILLPPVSSEKKPDPLETPRNYRFLLHDPNIIGIVLIRFGYMLCVGSLWSFLPLIADTLYHLSSTAVGLLISLIVFTSAVLSYPIGFLADRTSKRRLVFIGGFVILIGVVTLYFADTSRELYWVAMLFGLGGGFLTPTSAAMAAIMGKKQVAMGSVMSLLTVGHSTGMFVGPLLTGIIVDMTGDIKAAFMISGLVLLILLAAVGWLTRNYRRVEVSMSARRPSVDRS
jgi:MFS transporter, DHA1 family, multidrug resistance protein